MSRASDNKLELEKSRLLSMYEEQLSLTDGFRQRNEAMEEQMDHMRKEVSVCAVQIYVDFMVYFLNYRMKKWEES